MTPQELASILSSDGRLNREEERYLFVELEVQRSKHRRRKSEMARQIEDRIAKSNLPLLAHLSRQRANNVVAADELYSEGLVKLTQCIAAFDPHRGYRFTTYFTTSLLRCFHRLRNTELPYVQGRLDDSEGIIVESNTCTNDGAPTSNALMDLLEVMDGNLANLSETELRIVRWTFVDGLTQHAISLRLALTKSRVQQLLAAALEKLRVCIEERERRNDAAE